LKFLPSYSPFFDDSIQLLIGGQSGPGLSEDEPIALVVAPHEVVNRLPASGVPKNLLNGVLREPRSVYYRVYRTQGAIVLKTSSDPDDNYLGRIDKFSIAPPHNVSSLKSRIAKAEGGITKKIRIFKDTDGEVLMREFDVVPLLAEVYPGCTVENPMAVVCGEEEDTRWSLGMVWDPTFTKPFRADYTSMPDEENLPLWLPVTSGEIFYTDGIKITEIYLKTTETYLHQWPYNGN
ncbi:hypothetical protein K443DRAFT_116699, partial [Laccaria amethystina LaAM-08-1]